MAPKVHRFRRDLPALGLNMLALFTFSHHAGAEGQTFREVVFTDYGGGSSNTEIIRRLVSPLNAVRLAQELKQAGKKLAPQPLDLAGEKFIVYQPSQRPDRGYGLLVFVPPWQDARLPSGWKSALDQFGMIFVSAARSGNDESTFDRREPLALLAAHNIAMQYPVDPDRTYIAGFSGGSRIALRLALGYPDVFHGAILNAGSSPIGSAGIPLPPPELFLQFQRTSHLVYVTGERDLERLMDDTWSMRSMHQWCVFNVDDYIQPRQEHAVMESAALSRALTSLTKKSAANSSKFEACRASIDAGLAAKLQEARSLISSGRRPDADELLSRIDQQFGGLAAPSSVELMRQ